MRPFDLDQVAIQPCVRIFHRLDVNDRLGSGIGLVDSILDLLREQMRVTHSLHTRHQKVEIHGPMRSCPSGSQGVVGDVGGNDLLDRDADVLFLVERNRAIHQSIERTAQQREPDSDDVGRHQQADDRVDPVPIGDIRHDQRGDDAHRGPDIGHQVLTIGFQHDRLMLLRDTQHRARQGQVDHGGDERDEETDADRFDRLRIQQPLDREPDDRDRRDQDKGALDGGGKKLDFPVPIVVAAIDWLGGIPERKERRGRGTQIDQRLDRIRQETDRVGNEVRAELERDRDDRSRDREPAPFQQRGIGGTSCARRQ